MTKYLFRALAALTGTALTGCKDEPIELVGDASFYARGYIGKTMANGAPYNPAALTLACDDLPLGTVVYITYRSASGVERHAHATVTDRGPSAELRARGRIFDFSYALFRMLENPNRGTIRVIVRVVP